MFMGKVVDIDSQPRRRAHPQTPSKTALVLGGGGFTGGVYEIGALRALDLLAVNSTVNNFDIYVGTSAGSFVAGMLANGVTPDEMMQVINKRGPLRARGPRPRQGAEAQLPRLPAEGGGAAAAQRSSWLRALARIGEFSAIDLGVGLAEALPTGLYSGAGIADYVEEVLAEGGRANDFRLLDRELYLTATDLDTYRAHRLRREGLGRRADLEGDRVLDGAADRLQAGRAEGPPDGRRRHPLDHQRRHRGREGRQVHRRRQPDRPLRQRLREDDPDDASAPACGASPTWACRRSPTRPSASSPTPACTRRSSSGRRSTPASTSSWSSPSPTTS